MTAQEAGLQKMRLLVSDDIKRRRDCKRGRILLGHEVMKIRTRVVVGNWGLFGGEKNLLF